MLNMTRRQNNMYILTHADGQTTKVVASNVREVTRAIQTFKINVVTIQREPSARRSYKVKRV